MNLTIITDTTPEQEPISVQDAKDYLRLDTSFDDGTIQGLITAARIEAENEQGRECARKQFMLALDSFPTVGLWAGVGGPFWLEIAAAYGTRAYQFSTSNGRISLLDPLVSVDAFTYTDSAGTVHTLTENVDYIVDKLKHPGIVCPMVGTQWPTADLWPSSAVQITFTAGPTPVMCPANVKQGASLLVSQWYEGRIPFEAIRFIAELPFSVTSLLRNGKLWKF
jgi:hypothetical protein